MLPLVLQNALRARGHVMRAFGGHRVENIDDRKDTGPRMYFIFRHSYGIAGAIDALVMLVNHHQLTVFEIRLIAKLGVSARRVRFDQVALFRCEAISLG